MRIDVFKKTTRPTHYCYINTIYHNNQRYAFLAELVRDTARFGNLPAMMSLASGTYSEQDCPSTLISETYYKRGSKQSFGNLVEP